MLPRTHPVAVAGATAATAAAVALGEPLVAVAGQVARLAALWGAGKRSRGFGRCWHNSTMGAS